MSFLFSSTTTFDELLEKATSEVLPYGSEVMEVNLEICDLIRGKTVAAATAAKAIKRKINHRNPNVQLLALKVKKDDFC